jgi:predicted amidohydrolase
MDNVVRIGSCQLPEMIGAPAAALDIILKFAKEAEEKHVDLLLFPECFLTGYVLRDSYIAEHAYDFESEQFAAICRQLRQVVPVLVFGVNEKKAGRYFNAAVVIDHGELVGVYRKTHLIDPNELFYTPGNEYPIFEIKGLTYGINICYDAQFAEAAKAVADQGAKLLLSLSQNMLRREAAEHWKDKHAEICIERVKETGLWYVRSDVTGLRPSGLYGAERIGYGPTLAINPDAEIVAQVPLMTAGMIVVDIPVMP